MRILIVTDKYFPKALANAICAQNIAEVYASQGHDVQIIAYEDAGIKIPETYHGISVHAVKTDLRLRLFYYASNFPKEKYAPLARSVASFLSKTRKLLLLPWNPLYSLSFPYRILRKMEMLHQQSPFDLVISVYASFENALSGMWFKNRHPECQWCLYTLDTFVNQRQAWLPEKYRRAAFWLPKFLDSADLFVYMKSREKEYPEEIYRKWKHKMYPSDIPLMHDTVSKPSVPHSDSEEETWIYAGSLGLPHYDTADAIRVFLALPDIGKKRVLHIYSRGPEFEMLKKQEAETNGKIRCHDYVDHETLQQLYCQADILFSLKTSDQISAKIFEYMTFGKPVVHFSGCAADPNAGYIKQYDLGIVAETYAYSAEDLAVQIFRQLSALKQAGSDTVDLSAFEMNTAKYTCDMITDFFSERKGYS